MTTFLWLVVLIYSLVLCFVITDAFLTFVRTRVPFVPTPEKDLRELVKALNLTKEDSVVDIGSGNGRVVFVFAELSPARVAGIEAGLWMHWYAKIRRLIKKLDVDLIRGDFFKKSWKNYTIVYCYLYPMLMDRVGNKAQKELPKGSRVVSRDFEILNLKPAKETLKVGRHMFYIYEI